MMKSGALMACVGVLFSGIPPAYAAKAPIELEPSSNWYMDYADDACVLAHQFGTGENAMEIALTSFKPGPKFDLRAFGQMFNSKRPYGNFGAAFGDAVAEKPGDYNVILGSRGAQAMVLVGSKTLQNGRWERDADIPVMTAAQEAAVTQLTIGSVKGQVYHLKIGPMHLPMQAMRACTLDLLKHWGLDAAEQSTLTRPAEPIGDSATWLGPNDYPRRQLREGKLGSVNFRLMVDEAGHPTSCNLQAYAGDREFATVSCALLMQRAKLTPALDKDGKPVRSYYVNFIRWLVPD